MPWRLTAFGETVDAAVDDVLRRTLVARRQLPDNTRLVRRRATLVVLANTVRVLQLALEVLPAVLAEVLQASGLGTVLGVATFGEAVDAAIVYIVAGQARAGFVEALDMLQHLFGAIGRVSIMFKIAYTFA